MKNKELEKRMEELRTAKEALITIEELTERLCSAAEAIKQLQALKDELEAAQNKPGAV